MIRTSRREDVDALHAIDRVAWDASSTPAQLPLKGDWAGEVDPADLLVAEIDGEVVGYVMIAPRTPLISSRHVGEVKGIAVHPDARGRGLGRALLDAMVVEARRRGWERVLLNALRTNQSALALYRAVGFRAVGLVRDLFRIDGNPVDDYLLELRLTEPTAPPEWLEGGCHCGDVRFRVLVRSWELIDCNCSICTKKGILHLIADGADFAWTSGESALSTYTFGTGVAQHHFCRRCGMHPAYRPRSHPDGWDVNARCLDGDVLDRFQIRLFDGQHWEENVAKIR